MSVTSKAESSGTQSQWLYRCFVLVFFLINKIIKKILYVPYHEWPLIKQRHHHGLLPSIWSCNSDGENRILLLKTKMKKKKEEDWLCSKIRIVLCKEMTCQPELYLKKLCKNVHSCEFKNKQKKKQLLLMFSVWKELLERLCIRLWPMCIYISHMTSVSSKTKGGISS